MQLILVKIKWKYLIQKFHDICLSYYFKTYFIKEKEYQIRGIFFFKCYLKIVIFDLTIINDYKS